MKLDILTHFNTKIVAQVAFGSPPYYGWDKSFFEKKPSYKPVGTWSAFENKGKSSSGGNAQVTDRKKVFIKFPSVVVAM